MNQDQAPDTTNAKQQVIDSLKKANNVLITVSQNPTVDQLASCIGLALMLNKMNKHSTAIFSGAVPSTIEFLQPEKLLETNTDSLRDFIISLDRAKADKLRYKVEDNTVRIFITPYRTALSENDLVFSQGDFNVDAVVAMGVDQKEHLDLAIMQQGRILHDAVVIGLSVGANPSTVGSLNFHDPAASSIAELVVGIGGLLQEGLLDAQIATALLTGIVSETDRFRNEKTTAKVMAVSAQLMAAGANQQLVAKQLEVVPALQPNPNPEQKSTDPTFNVPQAGEEGPKEAAVSLQEPPIAPAPAVQLPGDLTEEEIKRIKIDEEGILHDDLPKENQIFDKPHKVIQPLAEEPKLSSSYINTPPERGGTLTAAAQDNPALEPLNPTVLPPAATPFLSHDSPLAAASSNPAEVTDKTLPAPVIGGEVNGATDQTNTAEAQNATSMPSPAVQATSTNSIDQDSARKAVLEAVASSPGFEPPKPIAALNAMPMDLGAPAPQQDTTNPMSPPPLPPPLTPAPEVMPANPSISQENIPTPSAVSQQGNTPFNLPPPKQ